MRRTPKHALSPGVKAPVLIRGLGQLGSLFAAQFVRLGHPVVPLLRSTSWEEALPLTAEPALVLIAVGEDDLAPSLAEIPERYRNRVGLLQNELRPRDWTAHGLTEPSVCVVWFERKAYQTPHIVRESVVFGPQAALLESALCLNKLSVRSAPSDELHHELCLKNLYILGLNLTGLLHADSAGELWNKRRPLFQSVLEELLQVELALFPTEPALDPARLLRELEAAIQADPEHGSLGRSAPHRLRRTLAHADQMGLPVPILRSLQEKLV